MKTFYETYKTKLQKIWLIFLASLLIISFIILTLKKIYCYDIWWHLATGKLIWTKNIIPKQDYFSYTFKNKIWIDSQWLFQATIYKVYDFFGCKGLIIFKCLIIGLTIFFIYKILKLGKIPLEINLILITLALWAASFRYNLRPHLYTYLFTSIFWYLLLKIRAANFLEKKHLLILAVTFIIWLNSHGSFIIGIGLVGIFWLETITKKGNLSLDCAIKDKEIKKFSTILIIILALTLLNPYGWQLLKFVLFSHTKNDATKFILEWQPLNIKSFFYPYWDKDLFIKIIVLIIVLSVFKNISTIKREKEKGIWLLWLIFLASLSIKYSRFLGLFCLGCLPLITIYPLNYKNVYIKYFINALAIIIFIYGISYIKKPNFVTSFGLGIKTENYPVDIVNFLKREKLPKPLFNDYSIGGFIIWKLYPKYLVFIDGRTPSLYSANFYWQYRMTREYPNLIFDKINKIYKFQTVITSDKNFASFLKNKKNFKLLGFENDFYLLSRIEDPEIKSLKIYDPGKDFNLMLANLNEKEKEILRRELIYTAKIFPHNAKAFNLLGALYIKVDAKLAISYFKKALKIRPLDENILANIGISYYNKKDYKKAYLYLKKSINIDKDKTETLKYLARTCYKLKKYKEGLKYIKKYFDIKKDPRDSRDYEYMGLLLYENNKFKQAMDYFKRSLFLEKDKKNKANLLYNIGNCYWAMKEKIWAEKYYRQALILDKNNKLAQKALKELKE